MATSGVAKSLPRTRVRFGVLGFASSLALITYLDRVCIMRAKPDIQGALQINDNQMGLIFSAFLLGYALFEVPGGWLGDTWGSRRVLTGIVAWWSLFTALTGCVWYFSLDGGWRIVVGSHALQLVFDSFVVLLLVRFLFGAGEAGAFPNITRVLGSWFPSGERGFAQGSVWMAARIGGAIAPFVLGRLSAAVGWRQAFWILGMIGFAWCFAFYAWFRDSAADKPSCNAAERAWIGGADRNRAGPKGHAWPPWRRRSGVGGRLHFFRGGVPELWRRFGDTGVVTNDLDGDGMPDLWDGKQAVSGRTGRRLWTSTADPSSRTQPATMTAGSVALDADLNGDGVPDVLTFQQNSNAEASPLLAFSGKDGHLQMPRPLTVRLKRCCSCPGRSAAATRSSCATCSRSPRSTTGAGSAPGRSGSGAKAQFECLVARMANGTRSEPMAESKSKPKPGRQPVGIRCRRCGRRRFRVIYTRQGEAKVMRRPAGTVALASPFTSASSERRRAANGRPPSPVLL
jgi:hypothetical protein